MGKIAGNPYPGWRAFQQEEHDYFHGRDADTAAVVDLWTANRLTIVTGPVASGKTSLLHAGVYPVVRENWPGLLPPGLLSRGMTFPFAAFPEHNPYAYALLSAWSPHEVPSRLAGRTVTDFLRQLTRRHDQIIFAAIDQAEDIAVDAPSGQRRAWRGQFLDDLTAACREIPQLHLLLVARAEALDAISASIGLGARYTIRPLAIPEAVEAVTGPAATAGRAFGAGTAEQLIDDLRTSRFATVQGERYVQADRVEPALLQAVCQQFWRRLPDDLTEITEWEVRQFADADAALAAYCGAIITDVAAERDIKAQRLHSWLASTFTTDSGTRGMAYEGLKDTAGMPNAVARSLADRHLLSSEHRSSTRWYQLLSDRLIEPLRHASLKRAAPPTANDHLVAARRQLALGEVAAARKHAERALHGHPALRMQADAESLLANIAHEQGEPTEALPHYRDATSLLGAAGDTAAAVSCMAAVAQTLLALGRFREAVAEFRVAVGLAPNTPALQTQFALALWQIGEGEAAVAILNDVLRADAGNREALRARGEILADLGDARRAMLDLERQSVRDRASTQAAHGLALARLGDYSGATEEIHAAMETAPRHGRVLLYAARASALSGDMISTLEQASQALDATNPPLSPSHREVAMKLTRDK
jgi:tetratricopeptide (TPR) repeat protein